MSQHSDRSAQWIGADSTAIDDHGDEQIGISVGDAGGEESMGIAMVGPDNSVFLQHVGKQHIDHILATVENKVSTGSILALLPASPERDRLRVQLEQAFPDHSCNCWGVVGPMKARLFEKMKVGDLLLIAPTYSHNDLDGSGIAYLGVIKALGPDSGSTELSQQLWGDSSYPYTIFFSAIKGFRSWREFFRDVGYQETKSFRGELSRIHPSRVPNGAQEYLQFLISANGGFCTVLSASEPTSSLALPSFDIDIHGTITALEGRRRLVVHRERERNQSLVRRKKRSVSSLNCEVCGFSFEHMYGKAAADYCEVHHVVPLSEMEETTETRLEDLAIVCANCHRVIHLRTPPYGLQDVRLMLNGRTTEAEQKPST